MLQQRKNGKSDVLWIIAILVFMVYEILNYSFFTSFPNDSLLFFIDLIASFGTTLFFGIMIALPLALIPFRQLTYKRKLSVLFPIAIISIFFYLAVMLIVRQMLP